MKKVEMVGLRFGRLVVLHEGPRDDTNKKSRWYCKCDCGQISLVVGANLRNGGATSCGCFRRDAGRKHGHSGATWQSPTYKSYRSMLNRCHNPNTSGFEHYGGKGIIVCRRWAASFANFLADMGRRPIGKTLDRRDSEKGYTPSNCRWASWKEQNDSSRKAKRRRI